MRRLIAIVVIGAIGSLGGCSDDPDDSGAMQAWDSTTTTSSGTSSPAADLSGFSECVDPGGDGPGGELLAARLATVGPMLNVVFETAAPLAEPSFSYYINIFSAGYQIGLRSIDGEVFRFVANLNEAGQENLTSTYTIDGAQATLAVPLTALVGLEAPFDYTAAITVDGVDTDNCSGTFSTDDP